MGKNKTAGQAETPATQPVAVRNGDSPRTAYRRWCQASLSRTIRCCRTIVVIGAVALSGCSEEKPGGSSHKEVGKASWYGPGFDGRQTASGERFDQNDMTAAHPTLPMGTKAKVTNLENGKRVEVTINDRGPFAKGRVIDLSHEAAGKLEMEKDGTVQVKIETTPAKK
ncbi:septal ring lytic transglycosylase RlpA family protein [uncultured Thiodictyon sp.]|uniref:septal ring lytic transglycosylase RlpA family protein n=1 Tax=uncultured Thiodictyon sp. TaxID=1846217 RepID=UPI0025F39EDC|nr:septal ring lytic transglycosylase RlpA family protein [uncultured Thiodictyon sp.]